MKILAIAIVLTSMVACSQSTDDEAVGRSTTWDENKEVVRQFMAIMDSQRFDRFDEVLTSDMVAHLPSGDLTRDQADGLVKMFYIGFPDLRHDVEEVVALEDGRVLLRGTLRGTHGGEFLGMPASQLPISFRQMAIYRIVNGRIAEIWEESDGLGLWQQIGVIPSDLTR